MLKPASIDYIRKEEARVLRNSERKMITWNIRGIMEFATFLRMDFASSSVKIHACVIEFDSSSFF